MRKHVNQLTIKELMKLPFYAWDCLTLSVKNKGDIYLVIRNEEVMTKFLKFLIYSLQTIDGNRATATTLLNENIKNKD